MLTKLSSEKIGENLKRLIKESDYHTQVAFAKACGEKDRTIRRWVKNGITKIDDIATVAKTLDVDVKALLF